MAHPKSLRMNPLNTDKFIKNLVDAGLSGIEVYGPNNGVDNRKFFLELCNKYSLIATVGSDYHGGNREKKIEIGKGYNNNLLISDYTIIEKLKKKKLEIDKLNQK